VRIFRLVHEIFTISGEKCAKLHVFYAVYEIIHRSLFANNGFNVK